MLKISMCIIFLFLFPLILGMLWDENKQQMSTYKILEWYISGYYTMLALFQLICVPMCFLKGKFSVLVVVYTIVIFAIAGFSWVKFVFSIKKKPICKEKMVACLEKDEMFYIFLIVAILFVQVYYALFYGISVMSYDDATYLVYANSAIEGNYMYIFNVTTGVQQALDFQRSLQSSIIFIAYLSKVTMVNVPTMAHTIMVVQIILIAYATYVLLAKRLFRQRDNRLIFMVLIEVLYIYGFYSNYSATFRLLGAPWQGKAIFAIALTPYLFVVLPRVLRERYSVRNGLFIFILSLAASSLSLAGAGTSIVIVCLMVVLYISINKKLINIFYIPWAGFAPAIYCILYLIKR